MIRQSDSDFNVRGNNLAGGRKWAQFMHRHSRQVPVLAHPGGPKHNEEI